MEKREFLNGMLELELNFDNFEISTNKAKLNYWYNYFQNIDNELYIRGIRTYITKERYKPTIASLYEVMKDLTETVDDFKISKEWDNVLRKIISKNGNKQAIEKVMGADNIAYKAADVVGIKRINKSQEYEQKYLFNEFKDIYEKLYESSTFIDLKDGLLSINTQDVIKAIEWNTKKFT